MCHPAQLRVLLAVFFSVISLATPATAQDQTLQLNQPIERRLGPGETHTFTITLEENTHPTVDVRVLKLSGSR